ncbi:hypothetical protein [Pantoea ananatis]|uniref:hypothetical protein n=1 Tax=Pantoea ananas TaxID=553 RepID=UPI001B3005F2|nr:hypothetical protein [Pantoea ananatis]
MQAQEIINGLAHPVTVQVINQGPGIWGNVSTGLMTAGAAIAAVILTHHFTLTREKNAAADKRQRELHFIATELIFMLEQFAEGCAGVATDEGRRTGGPQSEREAEMKSPQLELNGVTGDWRVLKATLMYRIHELPVLQSEARRLIDYIQDIPVPPDHEAYFRERQYQYARLGIKAVILVVRLRREAGLPATRLSGNEWSAVSRLHSVWRRERKLRAEEYIRNRPWHEAVPDKRNDRDEAHS